MKYMVAYSGYNESKASWLSESEISNALKILNNQKVSNGLSVMYLLTYLALD